MTKSIFYLVNGLNVTLYNVVLHGKIYRGFKDPRNRGKPTIIKRNEVSAIEGNYEERILQAQLRYHY
jgi:hypothetical protein